MEFIESMKTGDQYKALLTDCRIAFVDTYVAAASMCMNFDGRVALSALPITLLRAVTPAVSALSNTSSR